jgi:[amino group carrier protein]-L-2-aminoadipate/L-glutamate 6-kinase
MKVVVKVGGSLLRDGGAGGLCDDVASLRAEHSLVLVHGGGDEVTQTAERLGKAQRFVVSPSGVRSRLTDLETAEIYAMVMSGRVAMRLVLELQRRGVTAVSLSGLDGGLMRGVRKKRLAVIDDRGRKMMIDGGYTGKAEPADPRLLSLLISSGFLPVISPVALGEENVPLNVDGDRAATAVALGLNADSVVYMTNVSGLLLDDRLISHLSPQEAREALPSVGFGMQKKVLAAIEAVEGGVREAVIASGAAKAPVSSALMHEGCTVIS